MDAVTTHLVLELGQLRRERLHQFVGALELLLQVAQLVLFALAVVRRQRHGAHAREPVEVFLLQHRHMLNARSQTLRQEHSTEQELCVDATSRRVKVSGVGEWYQPG